MPARRYFVVLDANRPDGTIAAVHDADCAAFSRDFVSGSYVMGVVGTLRDALDIAVDEDDRELGYTDDDVKVHSCTK